MTLNTNKFHHEKVSSKIATEEKELINIFKKFLSNPNFEIKKSLEDLKNEIHNMITGYIDCNMDDSLCIKIQLLHSEFDADRLDYILRDSKSSGTSYGAVDIDYLISNLKIGKFNNRSIVGIDKKAINAADQFMINRFFSYTNVIFNDKVSFLGEIAEQLIAYFSANKSENLMSKEVFENEIIDNVNLSSNGITESFFTFNDVSFWNAIYGKEEDFFPDFIKKAKKTLLQKQPIKCIDETELRMITWENSEFVKAYRERIAKFDHKNYPLLISYQLTKHIPIEMFKDLIKNETEALQEDELIRRLSEGLAVVDQNDCHLLIDDNQSLIRNCWNMSLFCLREYKFNG